MNTNTQSSAKKILIIEDEGDICLLFNIILSGKYTDIDHVNSIGAAMDYLEKETPALILLDNKLPDGLGLDFIAYLKQFHPGTRIMMISGFLTAARKAIRNGADVFLEKPFTRNQVYSSVEALLN
jgi:DNA-binding NtrC family response regulator